MPLKCLQLPNSSSVSSPSPSGAFCLLSSFGSFSALTYTFSVFFDGFSGSCASLNVDTLSDSCTLFLEKKNTRCIKNSNQTSGYFFHTPFIGIKLKAGHTLVVLKYRLFPLVQLFYAFVILDIFTWLIDSGH